MSVVEALELRTLFSVTIPTAAEQEMLEWINHMRTDPQAALSDLVDSLSPLHSNDVDIQSALSYFHVDGTILAQEWSKLKPLPPLAWNSALADAARAHSELMIADNTEDHQLPGEAGLHDRTVAAGYTSPQLLAENIYNSATSVLFAHAAFAVDWGYDANGMQPDRYHRDNLMSADVREVGLGILTNAAPDPANGIWPMVVTEDFGNRYDLTGSWLLGVAYHDANSDGHYTAGEGLSGITVHVVGNGVDQTITTAPAGGYQILLQPGNYTVQFTGPGITDDDSYPVTVGSQNVKLDEVAVWHKPTSLSLSNSTVAENLPPGTVVGTLTTTDPDPQDTFTYSLITGTGSDDNSRFKIVGNQLRTRASFDYETQNVYQILIQTTDSEGLSRQKRFLVQVDDLPDPLLISGTPGSDVISLTKPDSTHLRVTLNGAATDYLLSGITSITVSAGDGNNRVSVGPGIMGCRVVGGAGNDTLIGGQGNDTLIGGAGNDVLKGKGGDDVLKGNGGDDRLLGNAGNDVLIGGIGNDTLLGGPGSNNLAGGAGDDTLYAGTGPDTLLGGGGDDWIYARNGVADSIEPGTGNDRAQIDVGLEMAGLASLLA